LAEDSGESVRALDIILVVPAKAGTHNHHRSFDTKAVDQHFSKRAAVAFGSLLSQGRREESMNL
jgi:hypothetical protein